MEKQNAAEGPLDALDLLVGYMLAHAYDVRLSWGCATCAQAPPAPHGISLLHQSAATCLLAWGMQGHLLSQLLASKLLIVVCRHSSECNVYCCW